MSAQLTNTPLHVAIVMDGNGRWAEAKQLPRFKGHQAGVNTVREVMAGAIETGVKILTLFAFSTENWSRPQDEVQFLFNLLIQSLNAELANIHKQGIRICFIGSRAKFSVELINAMENAEQLTAANTQLTVNVAADYGGRWDIVQACQQVATLVEQGKLSASDIGEETIASHLSLASLPPPDLFIRTSGEIRLSNFLLWDLAYSELYFTELLWPDFDKAAFGDAIQAFALRKRRYGLTEQQRIEPHG